MTPLSQFLAQLPRHGTVWIQRYESGMVVGGCGVWWASLGSGGWTDEANTPNERQREALGELVARLHDARILHSDVDERPPWPDARGPWRIDMPLDVLCPNEPEAD